MPVTTTYLDTLNSEQRRAVEHGVTELDYGSGGPLLVIAGAGSGKTNTLAHRVAHLIVKGADPRTSYPWCSGWATELKQLFYAYVEAKQGQNVLDYDDFLLYWAQMMRDPALAEDVGRRFDHVLVDD